MAKRKSLNEKRLTKKEVAELISAGGKLNAEYSEVFKEVYVTGKVKQDLVYNLPDGNILFVFDPNESYIGGKGDLYSIEYFKKLVRWTERVGEDSMNNRGSSVSHWRFYSVNGGKLIERIEPLRIRLSEMLNIDIKTLNKTYKSLDTICEEAEKRGVEWVMENIYDELVAYVGEVIIKRVEGKWKLNERNAGDDYPFIDVGLERCQYMPINVVWGELRGLQPMNLRKVTADEVRSVGQEVKFQRHFETVKHKFGLQ